MTAYATSHATYRESAILTATPERLVVMLFDGIHRFLLQGAAALRAGQDTEGRERVNRAIAIIDELQGTLDMDTGVIAERLDGIYVFARRHLYDAISAQDADMVEQADVLLAELREAFAEIAA